MRGVMAPRLRHYRPATKPLVTAWARHLDAQMRERDLSQTNVFDLVREDLGYAPTSRSAFLRVFSDKEPDARQVEALRRHFGDPPAEPAAPTPEELSLQQRAVIAAERQAAASEAQTLLMAQLVAHLTGTPPVDPRATERVAAWVATVAARAPQPGLPAIPPAQS